MGYDIYLKRGSSTSEIKKVPFKDLPHGSNIMIPNDYDSFIEEDDLNICITYNHSWYFYNSIDADKGIRFIYGKKASDVIPILKDAIKKLKDMEQKEISSGKILSQTWGAGGKYNPKDDSYWSINARNAIGSLEKIIALANIAPNFTFHGD